MCCGKSANTLPVHVSQQCWGQGKAVDFVILVHANLETLRLKINLLIKESIILLWMLNINVDCMWRNTASQCFTETLLLENMVLGLGVHLVYYSYHSYVVSVLLILLSQNLQFFSCLLYLYNYHTMLNRTRLCGGNAQACSSHRL